MARRKKVNPDQASWDEERARTGAIPATARSAPCVQSGRCPRPATPATSVSIPGAAAAECC